MTQGIGDHNIKSGDRSNTVVVNKHYMLLTEHIDLHFDRMVYLFIPSIQLWRYIYWEEWGIIHSEMWKGNTYLQIPYVCRHNTFISQMASKWFCKVNNPFSQNEIRYFVNWLEAMNSFPTMESRSHKTFQYDFCEVKRSKNRKSWKIGSLTFTHFTLSYVKAFSVVQKSLSL